MSTTVCLYNYEYNGQVYSPAFSDPPSPKDYNPDSEEDADETTLSPPATPKSQKSSSLDSNNSYKSKFRSYLSSYHGTIQQHNANYTRWRGCGLG